jgi:hypothetical protein
MAPEPAASWGSDRVTAAYRSLLEAVFADRDRMGDQRLTSHWPLVGTAEERVLVIGQAVFGWIPDWRVGDLRSPHGVDQVLSDTRSVCYERADPMDWIEENRVRSSPFWRMVRRSVEGLWPTTGHAWYSHVAWGNLYPVAPNGPKGNPSGALLEAQTIPSAKFLRLVAAELKPEAVIVLGGPYWWAFQPIIQLTALAAGDRPLLAQGTVSGHQWIAGMHPAGAQRRGWKPDEYARRVVARIRSR